jgi:hypothetical protein
MNQPVASTTPAANQPVAANQPTTTTASTAANQNIISDVATLMKIISKLDDNQKVQLGKLLQMTQVPKDIMSSSQSQTPIEIQNNMALRQLANKYGFGQSSMITNPIIQPPQTMEMQQINNKLDSMQYALIDIVRYMQEYTNKYVDMVNAKSREAIQEYVNAITEQGRKVETLKEMQETAKANEEKAAAEAAEVESSGGILGSFASGAYSALKGAVSKANSMMDTAGENISSLASKVIPGSPTPSENEAVDSETPTEGAEIPTANIAPIAPAPVTPAPAANQPTPAANQPTPAANQPAPAANQPAPAANQPAPAANQPTPAANQPAPVTPAPAANNKFKKGGYKSKVNNSAEQKLDELSKQVKMLNATLNSSNQKGGSKRRKRSRKLKKN